MADPRPCDWTIDTLCCPGWDDIAEEIRDLAESVATSVIWRLTGMRFGLCEVTLRPCGEPCNASSYESAFAPTRLNASGMPWTFPFIQGGQWYNVQCGCPGSCGCLSLPKIFLPPPADSIISVTIDGVVLTSDAYELQSGYLVRTDGQQWPLCQNMAEPATEPGTFQVVYLQGTAPPVEAQYAAGIYACELAKACQNLPCALPDRVTTLTREGVTMALLDPQDFLENGLTGIPKVDAMISVLNPYKLRSQPRVWSPDLPNPVRD